MRGGQRRHQRAQAHRRFLVGDAVQPRKHQLVDGKARVQPLGQRQGLVVAVRVQPQADRPLDLIGLWLAGRDQPVQCLQGDVAFAGFVGQVGAQVPVTGIKRATAVQARGHQRAQRQRHVALAQVNLRQAHGVVAHQTATAQTLQHGNGFARPAGPLQQFSLQALPAFAQRRVRLRLRGRQPAYEGQRTIDRTQALVDVDHLARFFQGQRALRRQREPCHQQRVVVIKHGAQAEHVGQSPVARVALEQLQPGGQRLRCQARPFGHLRAAFQPDRVARLHHQRGVGHHQRGRQVRRRAESVPGQLQPLQGQGLGQRRRAVFHGNHVAQVHRRVFGPRGCQGQFGQPPVQFVACGQRLRFAHGGLPRAQRIAAGQQRTHPLTQQRVARITLGRLAPRCKVQVSRGLELPLGQGQRRAARQIGHASRRQFQQLAQQFARDGTCARQRIAPTGGRAQSRLQRLGRLDRLEHLRGRGHGGHAALQALHQLAGGFDHFGTAAALAWARLRKPQPGLPPAQVPRVPVGLRPRVHGRQRTRVVQHLAGRCHIAACEQLLGQQQPQTQVLRFGADDVAQVGNAQVAVAAIAAAAVHVAAQQREQVAARKHQHQPAHRQGHHAGQRTP